MPEQLQADPKMEFRAPEVQNFLETAESTNFIRAGLEARLTKTVIPAREGETPDVVLPNFDATIDISEDAQTRAREGFIEFESQKATRELWWESFGSDFQARGVPAEKIGTLLKLRRQHKFELEVNGVSTDRAFEILECGDKDLTSGELKAISNTLVLIDQFSGGGMLEDLRSRRIVFVSSSDPELQDKLPGGIAAPEEGVAINMQYVHKIAEKEGIEPEVLLSVFMVHEILGHQLERYSGVGLGHYFAHYFDYSEAKVSRETKDGSYKRKPIHESVVPKDKEKTGSQPVRKYGKTNSAEDMATATEELIESTMGWDKSLAESSFKNIPDKYRRELLMQLMDSTAKWAKDDFSVNPGVVASPIIYTKTPEGKTTIIRERQFKHTVHNAQEAIKEELERVVEKRKNHTHLTVGGEQPISA